VIEIGRRSSVLWGWLSAAQIVQQRALRQIGWAFVALGTYLVVRPRWYEPSATGHITVRAGNHLDRLTAAMYFALAAGKLAPAADWPVQRTGRGAPSTPDPGVRRTGWTRALHTALGWWWTEQSRLRTGVHAPQTYATLLELGLARPGRSVSDPAALWQQQLPRRTECSLLRAPLPEVTHRDRQPASTYRKLHTTVFGDVEEPSTAADPP